MPTCIKQAKLPLLGATTLFLLAWLLPNHYSPWSSFYQDFASFLAGLLVLCALLAKPVKVGRGVAGFLFLPLVPLLQQAGGLIYFSGDALVAASYLAGFALMLLAGYNLAEEDGARPVVIGFGAGLLVVAAVLSCWIAWRQWLLLSGSIWVADLPTEGRPFANLGQPNNLATLLCMGLAGVLFFYEKLWLGRLAALLLAVFLIAGVALTQSRTPWVAALVLAAFWAWKSDVCKPRLRLRTMLCWIVVYALCVLALPYLAELLLLSSSDPLERARSLERWGMWVQLWYAVWQGPLWGYGWNQVSVAQVSVALAYPVPLMSEHSHNIMLDLLLWNGPILGGLIILWLAVWLARLSWQARSAESLFALVAAGSVLLHGLLEYPLEYAFFLLPLGLLLGFVSAEQRPIREFKLPRWLYGAFLLFATTLFGWLWQEYRIIEEDHRLMRFETRQVGSLKAEQKAPNVLLLTQLRELVRLARTEPHADMSPDELEWVRKVTHRYPYWTNLLRYALALGLNRQVDAAYEQMLILRSLYGDERYEEGRQALQAMQQQYPQLAFLLARLQRDGT